MNNTVEYIAFWLDKTKYWKYSIETQLIYIFEGHAPFAYIDCNNQIIRLHMPANVGGWRTCYEIDINNDDDFYAALQLTLSIMHDIYCRTPAYWQPITFGEWQQWGEYRDPNIMRDWIAGVPE